MTQPIRQVLLAKRRQLSFSQRLLASASLCGYIASTAWFQRSDRIGFYLPTRGEIDPSPLLERAFTMGKACYLPICHPLKNQPLWFVRYRSDEPLIHNRYGILEPYLNRNYPCKPFALDIVITPLVGFDERGNRLGSGKGYYDKTFAYLRYRLHHQKPELVGLAYSLQQTPLLTPQPWDIPLKRIVIFDLQSSRVVEQVPRAPCS